MTVCASVCDSYTVCARMWMRVHMCEYMHVCGCDLHVLTCVNTHACVREYGLCLCDWTCVCVCLCLSVVCAYLRVGCVCVVRVLCMYLSVGCVGGGGEVREKAVPR